MAALQVTSLAFGRVGKLVNHLSKKLRAQFLGHGQASMLKHVCVQLTLGSFAKRLPVSVVLYFTDPFDKLPLAPTLSLGREKSIISI